jgi:hypothetical protein
MTGPAKSPSLTMPVMLVHGDSDMYRPDHVVAFCRLLGGGLRNVGWQREHMATNRSAILPGLTHYDIFLAPELTATVMLSSTARSALPTGRARRSRSRSRSLSAAAASGRPAHHIDPGADDHHNSEDGP